ncbi:MCP methyltransferase, CheR-type [Novosphingobium nitrogenifigens DSM 19370]|uniref:Chemotaxis protein methyltransferase n=1 Tax=Novosphingobium nitrogenifigens DSM 19370 TaxID=983920 RepID=F1Z7Q5_9SPHN|nr:protein-glutamate O-methyltransferase CheR [Novosphingobium nitrogenifigens]EGD59353.1 MCP methyltransferase, CheR-type [Novosphingobium nitrogenifigens DSM 19370]
MNITAAFNDAMPGISPGVYSAEDFRAVSDIVYRQAGIVLPEGKAMLVYSRLAPLVRNSGCATFGAYVLRIREDDQERQKAICALTTNHTFFYREAHHFEHFRDEVRPALVHRLEHGGKVRLWSAGCSSGEETWSLGMTLLGPDRQAGIGIARRDVRILASDIATHALAKATAARYPTEDLKPVPDALRRQWTVPDGDACAIATELRGIVRFRTLNLLGEWPMKGRFDVIFCRNVMIYFDNPTKERLVARFAGMLAPEGTLYVGHSERVTGPALDHLAPTGPTVYRRKAA